MSNQKGTFLLVIILLLVLMLLFKVKPSDKTNTTSTYTSNTYNTNNSSNNQTTSNSYEIRKEFKQAMDSYESAMDEYIVFMTKVSNSKGTNPELMSAYGEYMKKYIDATDAFKKWEGKEMNKEEAKYYVDVQTRVNQKLMNASIDMSYK